MKFIARRSVRTEIDLQRLKCCRGDRGWMGQKKKKKSYHRFHYFKNTLNQIICMHLEAHYLLYFNHIFNYFFSNYISCCNFFNEIHFFFNTRKKPGLDGTLYYNWYYVRFWQIH